MPAQQAQQEQTALKIDLSTLESAEIEHAKPGPQSPQLEKDARRAMAHTDEWRPRPDNLSFSGAAESGLRGAQSYRQEDQRHAMMLGTGSAAAGSTSG